MDKFQGTAGPWEVAKTVLGEPAVASFSGDHIATIAVLTKSAIGDDNQRLANAQLLAIAPELFQELQEMVAHCKEIPETGNRALDMSLKASISRSEAAIARALGKEAANGR